MASFQLTNRAVLDLNDIWNYTVEEWSEEQADRYYHLLLNTCQNIADNPLSGKPYEGISPDLFGLRVGRHIIFYRNLGYQPVEITRILHERMDLQQRLTKSS